METTMVYWGFIGLYRGTRPTYFITLTITLTITITTIIITTTIVMKIFLCSRFGLRV